MAVSKKYSLTSSQQTNIDTRAHFNKENSGGGADSKTNGNESKNLSNSGFGSLAEQAKYLSSRSNSGTNTAGTAGIAGTNQQSASQTSSKNSDSVNGAGAPSSAGRIAAGSSSTRSEAGGGNNISRPRRAPNKNK